MPGGNSASNILWIAVAFGLAVAAIPSGSAYAQTDWRRLSTIDLPARVRAIVGLPATMDTQSCVTWGRWEVCFGAEMPVAYLEASVVVPEGSHHQIGIRPLRCKNPAVGEKECSMHLYWGNPKPPYHPHTNCFIWARELPLPRERFDIRCPSGVILE